MFFKVKHFALEVILIFVSYWTFLWPYFSKNKRKVGAKFSIFKLGNFPLARISYS